MRCPGSANRVPALRRLRREGDLLMGFGECGCATYEVSMIWNQSDWFAEMLVLKLLICQR